MLCLNVGCVGVSVVWSAQLGVLIHHRRHRPTAKPALREETPLWAGRLYRLSLLIGSTAWVYYAVIEEPITTMAHFCALAMGLILDALTQRWIPPPPTELSAATEPLLSAAY
jgi:hypothetical protein